MYWSASAQRLLGWRSSDVLGKLCYETLGGRDSRNYRFCRQDCPVMANARRGRPTPDYDVLGATASGEEKWLNVSVAVPKSRRKGFQVLHLFRDVSRRRLTEELAVKLSAGLRQTLGEEGTNGVGEEVDPRPTPLPRLSQREMEVLRLLATGMRTRKIAETLAIRDVTARNHISRLLNKLGVDNRLQAVVFASERRLI